VGHTFEVEIHDDAFVRDGVAVAKTGVHAVVVSDVISVSDRVVTTPGPVTITAITPPRARGDESVVITGTGFSGRAGQNAVRIGGFSCTITAESATSITATMPFLFTIVGDFMTDVEVENLTNAGVGHAWMWAKPATVAETGAYEVSEQEPGTGEDPTAEAADLVEAQDFERLVSMIEFILRDATPEAGDVPAHDGAGLVGVVDGEPGQALVVDPAEDTGLRWGWETDLTLPFGGAIAANPGAPVFMVASGHPASGVSGTNTRMTVPLAGTIDLIFLSLVWSGISTNDIDRVRILKNGVQAYDSGAGLNIGRGSLLTFEAEPNFTVAAQDYLEIEVTKEGTLDTYQIVGGLRLRVK